MTALADRGVVEDLDLRVDRDLLDRHAGLAGSQAQRAAATVGLGADEQQAVPVPPGSGAVRVVLVAVCVAPGDRTVGHAHAEHFRRRHHREVVLAAQLHQPRARVAEGEGLALPTHRSVRRIETDRAVLLAADQHDDRLAVEQR